MANKEKNIGILFLILGFLCLSLGGLFLIIGALKSSTMMMVISAFIVMLGVILYSILFILFIIYLSKRR